MHCEKWDEPWNYPYLVIRDTLQSYLCRKQRVKVTKQGEQSPSYDIATTASRWYVMRAYKSEKSAEEHLTQLGYTVFVPKKWSVRIYHGRKGRYLVPAIPSMVFVYATKDSLRQAKLHVEKLQFIMSASSGGNEPLVVADNDMNDFIKVASRAVSDESIDYLTPDELQIARGRKVRILGGPFDGVTGVFQRVKGHRNRRLVVTIPSIGSVTAEVTPDLVQLL